MLRLDTIRFITATAVGALVAFLGTVGCRGREAAANATSALVATGALADRAACAGDSLRPSDAAPAQGLWLYTRPLSRERVAAMIGPTHAENAAITVTRPVETMEIDAAGDTVRARVPAASVTLELLPPSGATIGGGTAESTSLQPAATYVLSSNVILASYEPCATSWRVPRVRYVRRDSSGQIVTDVMLQRASGDR